MSSIHKDLTSIDNAVAYIILSAGRHLRLHLQRGLRPYEIGPEQWFLLFRLYERDGRSQKELADNHANDFPNITRLVDALEKRGFVQRQADPDDRRKQLVTLSPAGREFIESLLPWVVEERKRLFAGVSDDELRSLIKTLKKIESNM